MRSPSLRHELRWLMAILLVEVAAVHIILVPAHLREALYAGCLFIALSAATLLLAGLILVRDQPLVWAAAGAVCTGAILAYVFSRSIGLPLMADDLGDWVNPLGVGAVLAEAIAAGLAVLVLRRSRGADIQREPRSRVSPLAMGSA